MTETPDERDKLLAIYLNDHLAGAVAGTNLARRLAAAERSSAGGDVLGGLAEEIEQDRQSLLDIMSTLDVPVRRYKVVFATAGEFATRFKLNGHLLTRSPLSRLVELETLRLGVEGKAAGWRSLRTRAESDPRLDPARLDDLIARATRQIEQLEQLRIRAAAEAFGGAIEPVAPRD